MKMEGLTLHLPYLSFWPWHPPFGALGCFHWGNMLTVSEMLRGSSGLSKGCLIEFYGKLKFPVGNLVTTITVIVI